jgi:hypothetical protein
MSYFSFVIAYFSITEERNHHQVFAFIEPKPVQAMCLRASLESGVLSIPSRLHRWTWNFLIGSFYQGGGNLPILLPPSLSGFSWQLIEAICHQHTYNGVLMACEIVRVDTAI